MIRLLRDGVAAIGFAGILSSASAATFRWSAEVSVMDMVPRHSAVAYIMNCGSVLDRIAFADLEVSDRADVGEGEVRAQRLPHQIRLADAPTPVDRDELGLRFFRRRPQETALLCSADHGTSVARTSRSPIQNRRFRQV